MHMWRQWRDRILGLPAWDGSKISDDWFRSHFHYAADVVHDWLGPVLDFSKERVVNFGCGDGITDLGLVLRHGAGHIHGIDIRQEFQKLGGIAHAQLGMARLPGALTFETILPSQPLASRYQNVDAFVSWSTFEHVQRDQILPILSDLYACLRPGGHFFLQIEPLYYSAFGAHLGRYDSTPWHHLLVSDEALWQVIAACEAPMNPDEVDFGFADFGPEGYKRFVFKEYQELNRLTADELIALTQQAGFSIERQERRNYQPAAVPEQLLAQYPQEWLLNNEILLLLVK